MVDSIGALARELLAVRRAFEGHLAGLDDRTGLGSADSKNPAGSRVEALRRPGCAAVRGSPCVSVVICTDGRSASLANVLNSLRWLEGPEFEVCVVVGPTEDGSAEELHRWGAAIKTATCPVRNLSMARNIGIRLAAGEIVAFLDDDAIPETEWLAELLQAYDDPIVGGAGGFVHTPDGIAYQCRFVTTDRLGRTQPDWERAAPELCYPLASVYPHLLGTNSSFRRAAMVELGGFDEEYEYFLDETDMACRMVDAGWILAQLAGAVVHHKFLPSVERNADRLLTSWYPVIKNRVYFGMLNGLMHYSPTVVIHEAEQFAKAHAAVAERAAAEQRLSAADRARLSDEVARALRDGLARGAQGQRRLPEPSSFASPPPFRRFPTLPARGRRHVICLFQDEAAKLDALARELAGHGNQVHLVRVADGPSTVDFEGGVWLHHGAERDVFRQAFERISARRSIDLICTALDETESDRWIVDSGIPVLRARSFPASAARQDLLLAIFAALKMDAAGAPRLVGTCVPADVLGRAGRP